MYAKEKKKKNNILQSILTHFRLRALYKRCSRGKKKKGLYIVQPLGVLTLGS